MVSDRYERLDGAVLARRRISDSEEQEELDDIERELNGPGCRLVKDVLYEKSRRESFW